MLEVFWLVGLCYYVVMKTILIAILAVLSVSLAGVLGYQKLAQPEKVPIAINQPVVNKPINNQPQKNRPCLIEGEREYVYDFNDFDAEGVYFKRVCCSGLTPLDGNNYLGADGVCYYGGGDDRILCTKKCGDGICGPRESECICPQDCGEPAFVKYNYRKIVNKNAGPWQTYKNEEHGFEMKYPKNYGVNAKIVKVSTGLHPIIWTTA